MAIKCDFEFKGITVKDGYIKVGSVSLLNYPSKKWVATINKHATSNSEVLCGSESVSFAYVDGSDPLKQAYTEIKSIYNGVEV